MTTCLPPEPFSPESLIALALLLAGVWQVLRWATFLLFMLLEIANSGKSEEWKRGFQQSMRWFGAVMIISAIIRFAYNYFTR